MSLPLLVNSADCGPVNPLQNLSKTVDRDRGAQQDYFGAGRAGTSRGAFRSHYFAGESSSQDAARFFSADLPPSAAPAFDLGALHAALPNAPALTPKNRALFSPLAAATWAADFLQSPERQASTLQLFGTVPHSANQVRPQQDTGTLQSQQLTPNGISSSFRPFSPMSLGYGMAGMAPLDAPPFAMSVGPQQPASQVNVNHWEREFQSQEATLSLTEQSQQENPATRQSHDGDELARIAGELVDTVRHAQNPKFKQSEFLGLMRQLRDGEVVLDGDKMVAREEASPDAILCTADVKGKGKAIEPTFTRLGSSSAHALPPTMAHSQADIVASEAVTVAEPHGDYDERPIDAYLRQDNEDYVAMQEWRHAQPPSDVDYEWWNHSQRAQDADWGRLQRDWDSFEATVTGVRPLAHYQFQPHNPYLLGEASRTRHHAMHSEAINSLFESVLELEAAVQRDSTNALRWYELGVRQQENEREQKAVQALRRSLELDPTHLPSWLALAVSHTNENNRQGTYTAIDEWAGRNERYHAVVEQFRASNPISDDMTQTEKFENLIRCLIAMARGDRSGQIDADIQIALAVLLNTNEEYSKARDCFNTALAIRPDDWLLYNRVGATLANSGHPQEALQYYYRALELNPAYIRARFNLGISCINLRRYDEAAQHILDALSLQDSDTVNGGDKRGVTTHTLWESLKTCCLHMQRLDLANLCDRMDLEAFRFNFQLA